MVFFINYFLQMTLNKKVKVIEYIKLNRDKKLTFQLYLIIFRRKSYFKISAY